MWSPQFKTDLAAPVVYPLFLVESHRFGSFNPTSGEAKLASFNAEGYWQCLSREGASVQHGELTPGTWERTYGTMTFGVTADIRGIIARGMAVSVRVGMPGYRIGEFQPVFLGRIRDFRWSRGRWSLELVELAGSLQNRFADDVSEQNLFFKLQDHSKIDTGGGDASSGDFDVVAAVDGYERNSAGNYLVRVTPDDGGPYYVEASALTGTTFTWVRAGALDTPLDSSDPPVVDTNGPGVTGGGERVDAIAWIDAHPLDAVRMILTSTGFQLNGPDDLLPKSWGFEIDYGYVDRDDIQAYIDATIPDHWDIISDKGQPDAQSWLSGVLQPAGMFLSTHQGCLTARAALLYVGRQTPGSLTINDDDLLDIQYSTWDPLSPVEYRRERVFYANSSLGGSPEVLSEDNLATRPAKAVRRRDLTYVFESEGSSGDWTHEVAFRLGPYDTRVPERFSVVCAGFRTASISIGDIVFLTSQYLVPRTARQGGTEILEGLACLVVGGGPDWFQGTCEWDLIHVPNLSSTQ